MPGRRVDLLKAYDREGEDTEDYDREGEETISPEISGKGCRAAGELDERKLGGL